MTIHLTYWKVFMLTLEFFSSQVHFWGERKSPSEFAAWCISAISVSISLVTKISFRGKHIFTLPTRWFLHSSFPWVPHPVLNQAGHVQQLQYGPQEVGKKEWVTGSYTFLFNSLEPSVLN
jgi:hypothetical protein